MIHDLDIALCEDLTLSDGHTVQMQIPYFKNEETATSDASVSHKATERID